MSDSTMYAESIATSDAAAGSRWLSEDESRAWRGFMTLQSEIRLRIGQHLLRVAGLSLADYEVLVHLSETADGEMRVVDLGTALQWEKSRLFHQITRMADRGLVVREACANSRQVRVCLTAYGRTAIEEVAPMHVEHVRRLFIDAISPAQVAVLGEITTVLLAHLDSDVVVYPDI